MVIFRRIDCGLSNIVEETIPRTRLTCDRERTLQAWTNIMGACVHFQKCNLVLRATHGCFAGSDVAPLLDEAAESYPERNSMTDLQSADIFTRALTPNKWDHAIRLLGARVDLPEKLEDVCEKISSVMRSVKSKS